uniref:Uncharacterized protein n=1 Tax=Phaeodactylum tricornutum TaxID=2850 RepID=A0A8J9X152_PHATR|mmetsp:Transcript_65104/g.174527  ORF Transcript_65104/g.174527 Transcript_65104/m.174527 type:complete len:717 (+) Transcript_65104:206-2356(+)
MSQDNLYEKSQSHYERKVARQRQLEMMEAAASGTAAEMELDTSSFAEADGSFMRQRNQETARRFLHDEDDSQEQTTPMRGNSTTGHHTLFGQRQSSGPSLNLMDHSAGVYTEQVSGLFSDAVHSVGKFIFKVSGSEIRGNEHDAIAATDGDVFLGDDYKRRSSMRATQCSTILASCVMFFKSLLRDKKRLGLLAMVFLSLFAIVYATNMALQRRPTEKILRENNSFRFNAVLDHIVTESVSHTEVFLNYDSAEYHALRWVAYSDPARLDPMDPLILQRYALAVFYYGSYLAFSEQYGEQKPIQFEGQQFEGVPNPGWTRKDYWMTGKGVCKWYGVLCEGEMVNGVEIADFDKDAPIIALNLTANQLHGTLPMEFKALDSLLVLDFSRNSIGGTIPLQLGRSMIELQYLFLNRNEITGTLPSEMGFMESVRSIRLGNNRLQGSIPSTFNRMYQLRDLGLDNNYITADIPDLEGCQHLIGLYLNNNRLNGRLDTSIGKLTNLFELRVDQNYLQGTIPPEVSNMRRLEHFRANNNLLTGTIPNEIFLKTLRMKEVDLQRNNFEGPLPVSLGGLSHLRLLKLNNNAFQGGIPQAWNRMHGLQILHLMRNKLTGTIPTGIAGLRELRDLSVANNRLAGTIPREIAACEVLTEAYFDYNQFTGTIPAEFGFLKHLETLRVSGNLFHGDVPVQVCALTREHVLTNFMADCKSKVTCECCHRCA